MDRLFINELEMDLSPQTVIALTMQINDLAELKDRQTNFSNRFKIPKTRRNKIILQNPDTVQSATNKPYQKLPAKVVKDGIEVVPSGYAIIESSDEFYYVTVYSGNVDFFDLIDGKKLSDLDLSAWDHTFNFLNIVSNRTNVTPYKYPLIDYGGLTNADRNVDARNLRAAPFLEKVVDEIFSQAPFNKSGAIFSNDRYLNTIIPFSNDKLRHSQLYIDTYSFNVHVDPFTATDGGGGTGFFVGLDDKSTPPYSDPSSQITLGAWSSGAPIAEFISIEKQDYNFVLTLTFTISSWIDASSQFTIFYLGGSYVHPESTDGGGNGTFTVTVRSLYLANPSATAYRPNVFVNNCSVDTTEGTFEGFPGETIYYGSTYNISSNLPDITQVELIKTIANKYGLFVKTDYLTGTLIFKGFDEIVEAIPRAVDWSEKLHWEEQNHKSEYRFGKYAQDNWLRYKEDSGDQDITQQSADGNFLIEDETLEAEADLLTLPFAATHMEKLLEHLDIPVIRKIEDGEFKKSTEPRLLIHEQVGLITGNDVHFFDGTFTEDTKAQLMFAYFSLDGKEHNLDFDTLLNDNYTGLIACFRKSRKITVSLKLTASDIFSLDHFIPVYLFQFGAYFYINKVINWTGVGLTKVELIRLQSDGETLETVAIDTENYELQEDGSPSLQEDGSISLREGGN